MYIKHMIIDYTITHYQDELYTHKLSFEDSDGVRTHEEIFPTPNKVNVLDKTKGRVCNVCRQKTIDRKTYCPEHTPFKSNYTRFSVFSKIGYINTFQKPETKEKSKETMVKVYGGEHPMKSPTIKRKIMNSCKEKVEEAKVKRKHTMLERYGVENAYQSETHKEKIKKTMLEKYGVDHISKTEDFPQRIYEAKIKTRYNNKYNTDDMEQFTEEFRKFYKEHGLKKACEKYGIHYTTAMRKFVDPNDKNVGSMEQDSLAIDLKKLTGLEFEQNVRSILPENGRFEIDILNREHKISIEYDGSFWHGGIRKKELQKAISMRNEGYTHIVMDTFNVDDIELISCMINPDKERVYARKCEIKEITSKDTHEFLEDNHLQGFIGSKVRLGLYHEDVLIQLMTFGTPRFNKECEWEIIRLCTHKEYLVVGGSKKLFNYFVKTYNPQTIVTYSDNKYFSGKVYEQMGFEFVENTKPNYVWFNREKSFGRMKTQRHKLNDLFNENFDANLSESDIMKQMGYAKFYDLGNSKWIWRT